MFTSGPVNRHSESISSLRCRVKNTSKAIWCERWESGSSTHLFFDIQPIPNTVRYQNLSRCDQVMLSRLRMQHYPTQSYLYQFNLEDDPACPLCAKDEETINHLLFDCEELSDCRTFSSPGAKNYSAEYQ